MAVICCKCKEPIVINKAILEYFGQELFKNAQCDKCLAIEFTDKVNNGEYLKKGVQPKHKGEAQCK